MKRLIVATRRSALALAQTRAWIESLRNTYPELAIEELLVTTSGDRIQDRPLYEVGGKGLFIKEIEEALLDGRADIAVHSSKDVPGELLPGLAIGCIPQREDPRDVVITREGCRLEQLPPGSRVGTSSMRRRVALAGLHPALQFLPLRGNVDTRLRRCGEGVVEAVVLARAGLARLGLLDRITHALEPDQCLPAVGQGALAIEQRADDSATYGLLSALTDRETALAVAAERGVMIAVGGSCQVPLAAYAVRAGEALWLRGMLAEPDGSRARWRELHTAWPADENEARRSGLALGEALKRA